MNVKVTAILKISETATLELTRVKDEKGDLVTDSPHILLFWRNHFSQLFSVHGVSDLRQTEIHTAEPLVSEPSAFEVEMATENQK